MKRAALFTNRKGNVAKPLRLALGACIIQAEYGFTDDETALMIQENPYLQYFCGYPGYYDEHLPFDPSSFNAYNEAGNLQAMAERFRTREGHYPSRILADKIYRNRDNLRYCKERGIHLTGPALGRPKKDEIRMPPKTSQMNVNAWKWSAGLVWRNANAAWG